MADDSYRGYGSGNGRGRGGSEPPTDPLTELARLIGQSDPFGHDGRRTDPRAAADSRDPAQHYDGAGYDDRYGTPPEPAQYPQDGYGNGGVDGYAAQHDGQAYADDGHHDGDPDPRGYAGAQYPQEPPPYHAQPNGGAYEQAQPNGHPSFAPPAYHADPQAGRPDAYFDDAPAPRRRGWLVTAAALVGLAVIGTAGAFAYRAVFAGGPPPLITRDVRPDKVAPPAQNADNGANKQVERLALGNEQMAPPPEQPINIPTAPQAPVGPSAAPAAPAMPAAPSLANQASAPMQAPAAPNNPAGPRKIRTVKITTDQEPGEAAVAPPRQIAPRVPAPRAVAPPPPHNADAPLSLAPQGVADAPATPPRRGVAPAPPMRTTALAPAENAGGSGYYVQVSAQKSQEEARSSFRNIQAKYASVLSGHAPVFRKKDLGSKGVFYGAQVGPFSHEEAIHLCEQLKTAGGSCMIQRN
ncbi:MAG TPA: SPOR domain-containing protein [Xanthobacteraceae bacterium]